MPAALPRPALFPAFTTRPRRAGGRPGGRPPARWRPLAGLLALLLVLLSGALNRTFAQTAPAPPPECSADEKFANTWYFGYKAGLDFNQATDSIPPKVLTDGAMTAPAGSGVMSDGNGKILFYSNGDTIWNGNGTIMTNGTGLGGNRLVTDGPLPIRMPGSPPVGMPNAETHYLIFTQDAAGGPKGLSYSEIVIPAGGPNDNGTVTLATKNTPLTQGTTEKMTAVFHKNGCDIWLIVHGWGDAKTGTANRGDSFLAYRVRLGTGVDPTPIISTVGSLHAASQSPMGYRGQMKVTPDGSKLALARYSEVLDDSSSTVELFNFDTGTGMVSANPQVPYIVDSGAGKYYGVDFSPGSYLYATVMNPPQLLQFDISGNGPVTKQVIPLKQKMPVNLGSLQAAPDGKIYVARENQPALGFIAFPDSLGPKARYADDSLTLKGRRSGLGLVNFNQSSLLRVGPSAEITGCRQIKFTAPSIDFDNKVFLWDFGDGATSTQKDSVTHVYAKPGPYTVTLRITTNCFCRQSSGSILVPDLPNPGGIAGPQLVCAGTVPALLTSTTNASSDAGLPLVYQWESSSAATGPFTAVTGGTGPSYQPANSLPVGTTYFRRRAQLLLPNGSEPYCDPRFTDAVAITVVPALTDAGSIAADQTVCSGTAAKMLTSSVPARGGDGTTYNYRWESSLDGTNYKLAPGAASGDTYEPGILPVTTYFRRRVSSGPCDTLNTKPVVITVQPLVTPTVSLVAPPAQCPGAALTFTAAATNAGGTPTFQWFVNNAPVASGPTFTSSTLVTGDQVRVEVTPTAGLCSTGPATATVTVTVQPLLVPGSIAADQTVCAGSPVAPLTSTSPATGGTGTFSYQWEFSRDKNGPYQPVGGATTSPTTYTPDPLPATTYYRRRVTSGTGTCATDVSNVVTITVQQLVTPTVSLATPPAQCLGTALTFAPVVANAGPAPTFQWFVNNVAVFSGPTFTSSTLVTGDQVRVEVTPSAGLCSTGPASATVTVTVLPLVTPTVSLVAPPAQCPGAALTFTAAVANAGPAPNIQWFVNNALVLSGPTTFTSSTLATGDQVRVVVMPTVACSTGPASATVTITVQPLVTPTVSLAPPPTQCPGTALTFAPVVANAGPAPTFQWFVNNVAVFSGPTFTSSTLVTGDQVRVEVTPSAGLCSTGPATATVTITVTPTPPPTLAIAVQPGGPVCLGSPLTFSIASVTEAGPNPAYQWLVDGRAVTGATDPVFTSTTLRAGQTVTLRLSTTNACAQAASVVSSGIVVQIQPPVVISAGPDKEILAGSSVILEGTADGTYPVTWTPALGLTFPNSPLRPTAAPLVTTTYTLSAGAGGCASSDDVTVTVRPVIRIPNAFTPNGDGRDDTWQIEFIDQYPDNTVSVFNRWGNRIFSADHYSRANEWRGDINGQPAPVGTYYYVVVTKGPLGRSYSGSITVLY